LKDKSSSAFRWCSRLLQFLALVSAFSTNARSKPRYLVFIGTYTDHGSEGVYAYNFDPSTGQLASLGLAAKTPQPSYLAVTSDHRFLYAVNELDEFNGQPTGSVSAFSIDTATGKLRLLNQVSSRGAGPAFLTLDKTEHYVLVANYGSGSVAVFSRMSDGKIGELSAFVRHTGSSVNPQRQQSPHAHAIAMSHDNRFAVVADLGIDQLLEYPLHKKQGTLGEPRIVNTDPGAGPRHLVFSANGKLLFVINELSSTVTVYSYDRRDGFTAALQTVSTLPSSFRGENTAGEIALGSSGMFLYASNRGDDSIAVFSVRGRKGTLKIIESVPSGGKKPRNFAIDPSGEWLLAANQDSNTICTFHIDKKTGRLTPSGQPVKIFSPAMVDFVALGNKKKG
jgi:6-phosphogluconolactonase